MHNSKNAFNIAAKQYMECNTRRLSPHLEHGFAPWLQRYKGITWVWEDNVLCANCLHSSYCRTQIHRTHTKFHLGSQIRVNVDFRITAKKKPYLGLFWVFGTFFYNLQMLVIWFSYYQHYFMVSSLKIIFIRVIIGNATPTTLLCDNISMKIILDFLILFWEGIASILSRMSSLQQFSLGVRNGQLHHNRRVAVPSSSSPFKAAKS